VVVTSFRVLEVRRSDVVPGLGRSPFPGRAGCF